MIITNVFGGLGNQMFQYAAGRALSLQLGQPLVLDYGEWSGSSEIAHNGFEIQKVFSIPASLATPQDVSAVIGVQSNFYLRRWLKHRRFSWLRSRSLLVEPHFHYWPEFWRSRSPAYLYGFWQSELYFRDVAQQIRQDFRFRPEMSAANRAWCSQILSTSSVSLHIRRGDYIRNRQANSFHGVCPPEYYRDAVHYIRQKIGFIQLFIFSDDMDWVRENLSFDVPAHYVDVNRGESSYVDMFLMSQCSHNIIANSSFSWWAAWLNTNSDKVVVSPRRWFSDTSIDTSNIYPEDFVAI